MMTETETLALNNQTIQNDEPLLPDGSAGVISDGTPNPSAQVRTPARAGTPPLNVAFVCYRGTSFLTDIEHALSNTHHVRTLHFDYKEVDLSKVQDAMNWADITWFEWCDQLLIHASHKLQKTSKVICRLHRFEAFSEWPLSVNWAFVDVLTFVSPQVRDVLTTRIPDLESRVTTTILYNGVDVSRFEFNAREPGFKVAFIGKLRLHKNPALMLQCIDALRRRDARYVLHVAGITDELPTQMYIEHLVSAMGLQEHVRFHGWVEDISSWLEDKHYLLSTSIHESFGYGIAEAMARGIKPLIHNFPGAEALYPSEFLFNSIDDFVDEVICGSYKPASYRAVIANRYSLHDQLQGIEHLFKDVMGLQKGAEQWAEARDAHTRTGGSFLKPHEPRYFCMNPWHHFEQVKARLPEHVVLSQAQNAFRYLFERYLNGAPEPGYVRDFVYLIRLLHHEVFAQDPGIQAFLQQLTLDDLSSFTSIDLRVVEAALQIVYPALKKRLSSPGEEQSLTIGSIWTEKNFRPEDTALAQTYEHLHKDVSGLSEYVHTFVVHGSRSTLDYTAYSDIDTYVILRDSVFTSSAALRTCRAGFKAAARHLFSLDPLQHHGFFFASEADLQAYPETYLPLDTLRNATLVVGTPRLTVRTRDARLEAAYALWSMAHSFRRVYLERDFPSTPHLLKNYTSRLLLLPTLYLEAVHNLYPYKRDSFDEARPHFKQDAWEAIDQATELRRLWDPAVRLLPNPSFYEAGFRFAEACITDLFTVLSQSDIACKLSA